LNRAQEKQNTTILTVDDEESIRAFLTMRLTGWGFNALSAASGRRGIELIEKACPDMVITDLYMEDGDGFELLAFVGENLPDLPVIVLSGEGHLGDAIRALRLGAWDYLYKPIEKADILKMAIEKALEKARLIMENREYHDHLEALVAQKSAELAAREKRFRTVADFTHDWEYWISEAGGTFHYISPSCERVTGYTTAEFIANPDLLQDILHAEDREIFARHLEPGYLSAGACRIDFRIIRKDGQQRWIGHTCQEVRDSNGTYLGRRCSNRDISYQKEIENNLITKQHALLNKTIHLEKANKNLEQANEALKVLLDQREIEKRSVEQTLVANLKRFVFPYLTELETMPIGKDAHTYLNIIRANIEQLVSPVSKTLSGAYLDLTPTEIKVADLIRQGESTKSIADLLNMSTSTVSIHRNKIRKKLNLLNKKINLYAYLNSLV
jgi:PAS domain S-box-containing protein